MTSAERALLRALAEHLVAEERRRYAAAGLTDDSTSPAGERLESALAAVLAEHAPWPQSGDAGSTPDR